METQIIAWALNDVAMNGIMSFTKVADLLGQPIGLRQSNKIKKAINLASIESGCSFETIPGIGYRKVLPLSLQEASKRAASPPDGYLPIKEAAAKCGVSAHVVAKQVIFGTVRSLKLKGKRLINMGSLGQAAEFRSNNGHWPGRNKPGPLTKRVCKTSVVRLQTFETLAIAVGALLEEIDKSELSHLSLAKVRGLLFLVSEHPPVVVMADATE